MKGVLITGATGIIGRAIAEHLHASGYAVFASGRSKLEGLPAKTQACDLNDPASVNALSEWFFAQASEPYACVSVAGNLGEAGAFAEVDFVQWRKSFESNFFAHAALVQHFVRRMKGKDGRVVLMSGAGLGADKTFTGVSSYSTAKAALTHFVEALAAEIAPITINAVAPGAVVSGMTHQAVAAEAKASIYATEAKSHLASGGVSPMLAAELVRLLLEPASSVVSGRLLAARFDAGLVKSDPAAIGGRSDLFKLRRIDDAFYQRKPK